MSSGGIYGDAVHGGTYTDNGAVTFYRGSLSQGTPIDFVARFVELRALSAQLDALPTNGTTTVESWGGVMLSGSDASVNVFGVDASAFNGAVLLCIHPVNAVGR